LSVPNEYLSSRLTEVRCH